MGPSDEDHRARDLEPAPEDCIAEAAGKAITRKHDLSKPQGARGRNSDNCRLREVLGWEPEVSLVEIIARTYRWIEKHVAKPELQLGASGLSSRPIPSGPESSPLRSTTKCNGLLTPSDDREPAEDSEGEAGYPTAIRRSSAA